MVILHTDPLPLRVDETGTIRVGSSRVSLDVIIADYEGGMTVEQIVEQLDSLSLADVHGAIAYYWRHKEEVEEYLRERREQANYLRKKIEAEDPDRENLKAKLLARIAAKGLTLSEE